MEPRVTAAAQEAFTRAVDETRRLSHASVRAEHIMLGVLKLVGGSAAEALDAAGVNRAVSSHKVEELLAAEELPAHTGEYPYHPSAAGLLRKLVGEVQKGELASLTSGRVLLELISGYPRIRDAIAETGVDVAALEGRLSADPQGSE